MDACSLPPACSWEEWGSLLAGGSPAPLPAAAVAPADAAPPLKRARLSGTCPYRGVSQHKGGERYEAHLWRNGKQVVSVV